VSYFKTAADFVKATYKPFLVGGLTGFAVTKWNLLTLLLSVL
jgi:hypothetical protein